MVTVLYFAWLRERIGRGEEEIPLPQPATVEGLLDTLRSRGGVYDETFADTDKLRAAVNQVHVDLRHPVADGDEVAFFPPVTGGRA